MIEPVERCLPRLRLNFPGSSMGRGGGRGGKRPRRPDVWRSDLNNKALRSNASAATAGEAAREGGEGDGYSKFVLVSPAFEEYYKAQLIVPEGEWDAFLSTLRKPLPVTFRINGSGKYAALLRDKLQTAFFSKARLYWITLDVHAAGDGPPLTPPRPLAWYPDNLAWHMSFSRIELRKVPLLARIHEFLVRENGAGGITRQEAVSMIPPLMLRPEPGHMVLDMCAAPGSKTFQLLEMIHPGGLSSVPAGLVLANDADAQRCHLLVHQTKRMNSPSLLVTNHDAAYFPAVTLGAARGGPQFDRVLADVPCSGDGTLRKAPDLWQKWTPQLGLGLHRLQIAIASRGVQLLKARSH